MTNLYCIALAALIPAAALAQEPTPEELHNGLRALKTTMETALNHRDIDTICANVTDDVVFTTMNGDVVRGPRAIRDYFHRMMEGPDARVRTIHSDFEADDLSHLYGSDVAVSFGHSTDHYELMNGDTFDVNARWSGTMVRREGHWRIASFHYSANMFDNPVLEAQRKYLIYAAAGGAVLLGFIGFLIGRVSARKKAK